MRVFSLRHFGEKIMNSVPKFFFEDFLENFSSCIEGPISFLISEKENLNFLLH